MTSNKFFALVFSLAALAAVSLTFASPAMAANPLLKRTTTTNSPSGLVRVVECSIFADGVEITRSFNGISSKEEKTVSLTGAIDAKINEAATAKLTSQKISPMELSYANVAYRTNGSQVVLNQFDGKTGEGVSNDSAASYTLREILVTFCGQN